MSGGARSFCFRGSAAFATSLAVSACLSGSPKFPTSDPLIEPAVRRAPGVAVDPALRPPPARPYGEARERLLVLSTPRELARVRQTVQRFFDAVVHETPAELDSLLAEPSFLDAVSGRLPARNGFRARFAQLDFSGLLGVSLYRERDLEIYGARDARRLALARSVPDDLGADEVFVRVRLAIAHAGKSRLFSDEMSLVLRSDETGYKIVRVAENTPVP